MLRILQVTNDRLFVEPASDSMTYEDLWQDMVMLSKAEKKTVVASCEGLPMEAYPTSLTTEDHVQIGFRASENASQCLAEVLKQGLPRTKDTEFLAIAMRAKLAVDRLVDLYRITARRKHVEL